MHGDGSVYRTENGRWRAALPPAQPGGKRQYLSGATRSEVIAKRRAALAARARGETATLRPPKLEEWLRYWLDDICPSRCDQSTIVGYRGKLIGHVCPAIGHVRIDKVTPDHLRKTYDAMRDAGLAPSSIAQTHRILRRAFKVAERERRISRNPCDLMDGPTFRRKEVQPLSQAEARRILRIARTRRNTARWSVALALGLRQGEALGLAWESVDLDQGTITIRWQLRRMYGWHGCGQPTVATVDGSQVKSFPCGHRQPSRCPKRVGETGLHLRRVKSDRSNRTINLPAGLVKELRQHRETQAAERTAAGRFWATFTGTPPEEKDPRGIDLVFTHEDGRAIDPRQDYEMWLELLAEADVEHARLHDARHTAASLLLAQGVPTNVIRDLLGHSSSTLTRETYAHVTRQLADAAAAEMHGLLWGDEGDDEDDEDDEGR